MNIITKNTHNTKSSTSSSSSLGINVINLPACAACKYQRRRCAPNCPLAPFFPPENPKDFLNAHKLFGVSNMTKVLKGLKPFEEEIAMKSMIYQANVRANDPVGGCYRVIKELKRQIHYYKVELDLVLSQLEICRAQSAQQEIQNIGIEASGGINMGSFSVYDSIDQGMALPTSIDDEKKSLVDESGDIKPVHRIYDNANSLYDYSRKRSLP